MPATKITDVMSKIVELLTPLDSNERQRVVRAAFTLLNESPVDGLADLKPNGAGEKRDTSGLPPRAATWMQQHKLTQAQIQQVFHIQDGQAEVIASDIPGKGQKAKTINAYLLQGLRGLLSSGEPNFDDKSARKLCQDHGCYDKANHSVFMKTKGSWVGSKKDGWKLTSPGLKQGAELVKTLTTQES